MKKRIIALLLVCLMVVSAVPAWVGAEETAVADAAGTSEAATCPGEGTAHTLENCPGATPIGHKDPTCADNEETQYQCPVCEGTFWVEVKDTATGLHSYKEMTPFTPATCEAEGHTAELLCTVCGYKVESKVIPAKEHEWVLKDHTGDCTVGGTVTWQCQLCKEEKTEQYQSGSGGHVWKPEAEILVPPTCKTKGKARYTCAFCGETMDVVILEADCADMQTLEWVAEQKATCTKDGVKAHWHCTVCGKDYDKDNKKKSVTAKDLAIPALKHSYETSEGGTKPTCEADGFCTRCGKVSKLGHTPKTNADGSLVWTLTRAPKCLEVGVETNYCARCSHVMSTRTVAPLQHTSWEDSSSWERKYGDSPCDGTSGVRFWRCGRCNEIVKESIGGGAHNIATYEIPVRCNRDGAIITYCKYGQGCTANKYIVDTATGTVTVDSVVYDISELLENDSSFVKMDDGKVYIAIVSVEIKAADGARDKAGNLLGEAGDPNVGTHSWVHGDDHDLPKCETAMTARCEWCDVRTTLKSAGHDWEEVSSYKAPDCINPGQKAKWVCSRCGETHSEYDGGWIAPLGHSFHTYVNEVPATHNADGSSGYWKCDRCGAIDNVRDGGKSPLKSPHSEDLVNAKNPNEVTCGEDGYTLYRCTSGKNCDRTDYVDGYIVKGYRIGGEHDFQEPTVKTAANHLAPTCTEDGWVIETCNKCSATRKVTLAKLGHHNLLGEELFDDCRDTTTHRYCETCGETIGQSHAPEAVKSDKKAATCTENGYEKEWCTNCGRTLKDETIAATGHTKGNWVTKSAPDGLDQEICPKCNTVLSSKTTTRPGFDYELTADNAVVSEAGYVDSSLVAVTVALKSKGVGVSSILFDLTYDKDVVKFVKYEFDETTPFISGRRVNDLKDKGSVRVLASIPNDEAGKVADTNLQNVKGDVIITLYFRIISDSASSATFGIDMTTSSAINKSEKPVEFFGDTEAIVIGNILDLNKDGSVDLADAQIMLKMINRELMDDAGQAITYNVSADVDKDGSVNADDLSVMYDYLAGIVDYEDVVKLGTEGDPVDPAPEEDAA